MSTPYGRPGRARRNVLAGTIVGHTRDDASDWPLGHAPLRRTHRPVPGEWADLLEDEFEERCWEGRTSGIDLCEWPSAEPCMGEATDTSPYCPVHVQRVYTRGQAEHAREWRKKRQEQETLRYIERRKEVLAERDVTVVRERKRPDEFYVQMAKTYRQLAKIGRRPAAEIAEFHGVPVATVHGWVKEARRRGHLPPGQRTRGPYWAEDPWSLMGVG